VKIVYDGRWKFGKLASEVRLMRVYDILDWRLSSKRRLVNDSRLKRPGIILGSDMLRCNLIVARLLLQ